ncbi:GNAT family N-acetyltransferase [Candidatus Woesebacteria bacterium]|nr:GNAT family N-acetyltransferase [Candidatus Woesebacteria bacterium]
MELVFVDEKNLTANQKEQIKILEQECFSDVDLREIAEDFIAESFGRLFTDDNNKIVGMLSLFKRNIEFEGENILLGGMGGVCVTKAFRGKGIATEMLKKGIEILKKEGVEIACLNVDRKKGVYGLYEKLGFRFIGRDISFEDVNGKIKYDNSSMFMPINSEEKYQKVMNSKTTFHQGRGYW